MDRDENSSGRLIVRTLRQDDGPRLVRIDEQISGRKRTQWFSEKLARALKSSDVCISLGADNDGQLVGAVLGTLQFGEFGQPEPVAVLDTVLVDPAFRRQGVATALLDQLLKNLRGLRISQLRTEVGWDEFDLLAFFARAGFKPAPRLVLELPVQE